MPGRRKKNAASVEKQERLMRQQRLKLLVQQCEAEAQQRVLEVQARLEDLLASVDRVFEVELMKIPPTLQSSSIMDHMGEPETAGDSPIALEVELAGQQKAQRTRSRKGESTHTRRPEGRSPMSVLAPGWSAAAQKPLSKSTTGAKGGRKAKVLSSSISSGNLGCQKKRSYDAVPSKPKLRSTVSTGDLHCSAGGSMAHISVTTALGQTVCISEETKDELDMELLDDVALVQIQKLAKLMSKLAAKAQR
ncbi:borealin-2 [Neosynchiropus ocellatus]